MTGPAFERVISALEAHGHKVRRQGCRATTWCTHPGADNPNALSIFDNGSRVLMHCFTRECRQDDIAESLGLTWRDLYHEPHGDDLATYRYDDGRVVHRRANKSFSQSGNKAAQPTLYRSSKVADAVSNRVLVWFVEGEEDVHSLETLGAVATTAPMGARNVDKVDVSPLQGADVVAVPDQDSEGSRWAELVAARLDGVVARLRFALPASGKDASDHIAAGLGLADFRLQDEAAAKRADVVKRYPALDLNALLDPNRPPREYVVDGLLPAGVSVTLAAPAGTGKSLLTLAIALSVARGRRSFAGLTIPRPRRVLYVDMENTHDDLAERFESFGIRQGDSLGGLTYLSLPELPPLDTGRGADELMAIIDAYRLGAGDLVILDSLQRVIQGEENAADTIRAYYLHTGIRLKRLGVTSLRLDNTGKDVTRGSRGTSGKRDDVDLELVMTPDDDDPGRFRVAVNKTRLSDMPPLTLTRFVNRDGRTVFSTSDDPFRTAVSAAKDELDRQGVPNSCGLREARDALVGRSFHDHTIRVAVRERRGAPAHTQPCCDVCGMPMTDLGDDATTHPGCEEN